MGTGDTPVVLAVSGHDPTGAAGVQADVEAVAAMGCACVSLVTVLTAQNTARFVSLSTQPAAALRLQAEVLLEDVTVTAIKIGAVGNMQSAEVLVEIIARAGYPTVVWDPVMYSSTGGELAHPRGQRHLLKLLAPHLSVITPNRAEARMLADVDDVEGAARGLLACGCRAVLITDIQTHLYRRAAAPLEYTVPALPGRYHGSGCTLSAALTACLAQGHSLPRATRMAVHYTWECLRDARQLGREQQHPRRWAGNPAPALRRGLYAIADTGTLQASQLLRVTAQVLSGGAVAVQYRAKAGPQPELARSLQSLCRSHHACFIVNDDLPLACELSADGVHLGRDDVDPAAARAALGPQAIIGVSCYDSLERARAAELAGADYVAFGSFFASATRRSAVRPPLTLLERARRAVSVPVVAIGGITAENAAQPLAQGADMVAVIRDLYLHPEPQVRAQEYTRLWTR